MIPPEYDTPIMREVHRIVMEGKKIEEVLLHGCQNLLKKEPTKDQRRGLKIIANMLSGEPSREEAKTGSTYCKNLKGMHIDIQIEDEK